MRSSLVVAFALLAGLSLLAPTAAAGPIGCGCDPIVLVLVVTVIASCTAQDVGYLAGASEPCWGITPAVECAVHEVERQAGLGEACPA